LSIYTSTTIASCKNFMGDYDLYLWVWAYGDSLGGEDDKGGSGKETDKINKVVASGCLRK
jgi:hypothetical protein